MRFAPTATFVACDGHSGLLAGYVQPAPMSALICSSVFAIRWLIRSFACPTVKLLVSDYPYRTIFRVFRPFRVIRDSNHAFSAYAVRPMSRLMATTSMDGASPFSPNPRWGLSFSCWRRLPHPQVRRDSPPTPAVGLVVEAGAWFFVLALVVQAGKQKCHPLLSGIYNLQSTICSS